MKLISLRLISLSLSLGPVFGVELTTRAAPTSTAARHVAWAHASPGATHTWRLTVLDLDRDGVLSAAEIASAPIVLSALDLDSSGTVPAAELLRFRGAHAWKGGAAHAIPAGVEQRRAVGLGLFAAVDANGDGSLQPMEIANAVLSLQTLDRNGDGQITASELALDNPLGHEV